jgi:large subunit ribosomal protein L21
MHPFEDAQGYAGFAPLGNTGVCAARLPMQSTLCMRPNAAASHWGMLIFECASFYCRSAGGFVMYAVIRTGGKQYRVAPGDVVKIESVTAGDNKENTVEFSDVIAVSGEPGTIAKPSTAKVTAEVVGDGRGDKILVFHLKRKKQYKKLQGTPAKLYRGAHQGHRGRRRDLYRDWLGAKSRFLGSASLWMTEDLFRRRFGNGT